MSQYITKQRKILLRYFGAHVDEPLSAQQIALALEKENISISAVYRNLAILEKNGRLQRVRQGEGREVCYRYKDIDTCEGCLHLSCKKCGKTFHLNHTGADEIMHTLADTENFSLDKSDTILYGICGKCKKTETKTENVL